MSKVGAVSVSPTSKRRRRSSILKMPSCDTNDSDNPREALKELDVNRGRQSLTTERRKKRVSFSSAPQIKEFTVVETRTVRRSVATADSGNSTQNKSDEQTKTPLSISIPTADDSSNPFVPVTSAPADMLVVATNTSSSATTSSSGEVSATKPVSFLDSLRMSSKTKRDDLPSDSNALPSETLISNKQAEELQLIQKEEMLRRQEAEIEEKRDQQSFRSFLDTLRRSTTERSLDGNEASKERSQSDPGLSAQGPLSGNDKSEGNQDEMGVAKGLNLSSDEVFMEQTTCVDYEIEMNRPPAPVEKQSHVAGGENEDSRMDETDCLEATIDQGNVETKDMTLNESLNPSGLIADPSLMEETKCISSSSVLSGQGSSPHTQSVLEMDESMMVETKCISSLAKLGDPGLKVGAKNGPDTDGSVMGETQCVQVNETDRLSVGEENGSLMEESAMEETKCISSLMKHNDQNLNMPDSRDETFMEETRCISSEFQRVTSVSQSMTLSTGANESLMEQTKCVSSQMISTRASSLLTDYAKDAENSFMLQRTENTRSLLDDLGLPAKADILDAACDSAEENAECGSFAKTSVYCMSQQQGSDAEESESMMGQTKCLKSIVVVTDTAMISHTSNTKNEIGGRETQLEIPLKSLAKSVTGSSSNQVKEINMADQSMMDQTECASQVGIGQSDPLEMNSLEGITTKSNEFSYLDQISAPRNLYESTNQSNEGNKQSETERSQSSPVMPEGNTIESSSLNVSDCQEILMEETKCISTFVKTETLPAEVMQLNIKDTNTNNDFVEQAQNTEDIFSDKNLNENGENNCQEILMEETKCISTIVNRVALPTEVMKWNIEEEYVTHNEVAGIEFDGRRMMQPKSPPSVNRGSVPLSENFETCHNSPVNESMMEETKCISTQLRQLNNVSNGDPIVSNSPHNPSSSDSPSNVSETCMMEETKCVSSVMGLTSRIPSGVPEKKIEERIDDSNRFAFLNEKEMGNDHSPLLKETSTPHPEEERATVLSLLTAPSNLSGKATKSSAQSQNTVDHNKSVAMEETQCISKAIINSTDDVVGGCQSSEASVEMEITRCVTTRVLETALGGKGNQDFISEHSSTEHFPGTKRTPLKNTNAKWSPPTSPHKMNSAVVHIPSNAAEPEEQQTRAQVSKNTVPKKPPTLVDQMSQFIYQEEKGNDNQDYKAEIKPLLTDLLATSVWRVIFLDGPVFELCHNESGFILRLRIGNRLIGSEFTFSTIKLIRPREQGKESDAILQLSSKLLERKFLATELLSRCPTTNSLKPLLNDLKEEFEAARKFGLDLATIQASSSIFDISDFKIRIGFVSGVLLRSFVIVIDLEESTQPFVCAVPHLGPMPRNDTLEIWRHGTREKGWSFVNDFFEQAWKFIKEKEAAKDQEW